MRFAIHARWGAIMSSGIEAIGAPAEEVQAAPDREWAAHRSALRTPELRSVLEQLQSRLEPFLKDGQRP